MQKKKKKETLRTLLAKATTKQKLTLGILGYECSVTSNNGIL